MLHEDLRIIETHAHYDHRLYKNNGPSIVKALKEWGGIDKIVIPAISFESNYEARQQFGRKEFPYVYFATGIHPYAARGITESNIDWKEFEKMLSDKRTVAVKTGLDYIDPNMSKTEKDHQCKVLRKLIGFANEHDLPVVIHVRDMAVDDLLNELSETKINTTVEVHCFVHDFNTMQRMIDSGIRYFGIGGAVTKDYPKLRECVTKMPLEMLLLETDSPFQKPRGYSGKLNSSYSLETIAQEIAGIKGISVEEVVAAANSNACNFFGWNE